jgi:nitroreductase
MNVWDAIEARKSYRIFKKDPVSKKLIRKIITAGGMAPSSANMQPWEFVVVAGQKRDELSQVMLKSFIGQKKNYDILGKDSFFPQKLLDRRKKFFADIFKKLSRHNESPMKYVMQGSLRFYDAPIIMFTFIDKRIAKRFLFDVGACVQNLVLAAQSEGLGTHLLGLVLKYQDDVKKMLHISENKEMVVGICLGYPDMENSVNDFTPGRAEIDQFVKWVGI